MFYFILDNEISLDKNIKVTKRPAIPSPEKDYLEYSVNGRNGSLYRDLETYKDIEITIEMNYVGSEEQWNCTWRSIKKWLLKGGKGGIRNLSFSDDLGYYYKVKKIELGSNERKIRESGEFNAIFLCKKESLKLMSLT